MSDVEGPPLPFFSVALPYDDLPISGERDSRLYADPAWYHLIIAGANDGTWDYEPATDTFAFSPRLSAFFGYSPNMYTARVELRALVHPRDRERVQHAFERIVREGAIMREDFELAPAA